MFVGEDVRWCGTINQQLLWTILFKSVFVSGDFVQFHLTVD